ncbi:PRKCH [Bugula neritina]|uniref:PRKCH n=1 Tax=Bugula neritina TaxID=10212 RepID=A0A7J7K622_BUGNE|nr:PRKCH [Bugula neritina]
MMCCTRVAEQGRCVYIEGVHDEESQQETWVYLQAPFKPKIKTKYDANNFDKDFTSEQPTLTPTDKQALMDVNQEEFRGFSYVNPDFGKWTVALEPAKDGGSNAKNS